MEQLAYTIDETARALGISRGACYRAAKAGELPVIRVGGRLVIPKAELEQFLRAQVAGEQNALA